MKTYIPTSMIKKTKSMARHNSDIKQEAEITDLVNADMMDIESELGCPMIDAIKSTVVTVAIMAVAMAVAHWGFYG